MADKAYDCDDFRAFLRRTGVIPSIPPRKNRTGRRKTWEEEYKERWHIEQTFAWVGNFRRLLVRYEELISLYTAFFTVACILICLRTVMKKLLDTFSPR